MITSNKQLFRPPFYQRPGWIYMTGIILKFFFLEDLSLSDAQLVDKYHDVTGGSRTYDGNNPYLQENQRKVDSLLVKALRRNILYNLRHERV